MASWKKVWQINFSGAFRDVSEVAFSPNGKIVAIGLGDGTVRICDSATGKESHRWSDPAMHNKFIRALAFSPAGKLLAFGTVWEDSIYLWDTQKGSSARVVRWALPGGRNKGVQDEQGIFDLAFAPDGKTVAVACRDRKIRLFEVVTGGLRHAVRLRATRVVFCARNCLLATGQTTNGDIQLWDWRPPPLNVPARLSGSVLEQLWVDCAAKDATVGYRGVIGLLHARKQAVELLGKRLQRIAPVSPRQLERLMRDLDDEDFAARLSAVRQLAMLGRVAEGRLRAALAPNGFLPWFG
jgi:hypothetical protein